MTETPDPVDFARQLLARHPSSSSAFPAWTSEAERVIAALEASMVSLDYRARQLLQQTGDLRAAASDRSLLGRFRKSEDEKKNLAEQEVCLASRAVCKDLIDQLRRRMGA